MSETSAKVSRLNEMRMAVSSPEKAGVCRFNSVPGHHHSKELSGNLATRNGQNHPRSITHA